MSSTPTPAVLGPDDLAAALDRLPDWRGRLGALHTAYVAPSAVAALALVAAIGKAAESVDHYLDVDWRYDHVFVRSTTHQAGDEVTEQDIRLATR
ncbi:MAG: 4a-hydroxytetrahydrobiopterin dehydratase, partial [Dermatophilaceae bacterium]